MNQCVSCKASSVGLAPENSRQGKKYIYFENLVPYCGIIFNILQDFILWHKAHKNVPPEPHEIIRVLRPPESKERTNLAEGEDYKVRKAAKERDHSGRKLFKDRSGTLMNHPGARMERSKTSGDLSDKGVERAIKDRSRSVYQVDYLGAPLGKLVITVCLRVERRCRIANCSDPYQ